jgi:hypothetical protein|tara:strand:- start:73 stop:312 length:240 start_codon:yes stop_codon:yes gene_type:complete
MSSLIKNQKQATEELERLRPIGEIRGANDAWPSEVGGQGGKIKATRANSRPRPFTPAGHIGAPPTSPDFGGTGLKVMGS